MWSLWLFLSECCLHLRQGRVYVPPANRLRIRPGETITGKTGKPFTPEDSDLDDLPDFRLTWSADGEDVTVENFVPQGGWLYAWVFMPPRGEHQACRILNPGEAERFGLGFMEMQLRGTGTQITHVLLAFQRHEPKVERRHYLVHDRFKVELVGDAT